MREKERLARESGLHLEFVGLLRKCMYGAVDASARRQGHYAQTYLRERPVGAIVF